MHQLTIIGDRQDGKTYALIDMAIDTAARQGGAVLYQCESVAVGRIVQRRIQERVAAVAPKTMVRSVATNGRERIVFINGGVIDFTGNVWLMNGRDIDLHCMDGVFCGPHPRAKRAVRAVLR